MNYIYEMHLTHLRIQYLLPDNMVCWSVTSEMIRVFPYESNEFKMRYECSVFKYEGGKLGSCMGGFKADTLPRLIGEVRMWIVKHGFTHSNVDKLREAKIKTA